MSFYPIQQRRRGTPWHGYGRLCGQVLLLMLGFSLVGCGQKTAKIDLSELQDPLIRKAKAKVDRGDRDGALDCLNQALDKHPGLAQAHLDAGLLYDEYKKNYIRAIYHYQRYLELRPDTEKKSMIQDLIHKAMMSFAASVSDQLPGYSAKFKALQDENSRLKNERREGRDATSPRAAGASISPGAARPAQGKAAGPKDDKTSFLSGSRTGQVYQVQEHETLSLIATKVYQNPGKWKLIYDANRGTLASPEKLRPGQVLIIPR